MRPLPVFRLDADVTAAGRRQQRPARVRRGADAGVLVGTQMVAKGHDFPAVTLAVVLDADSTLRFPDFRAEERTFALVAQLAGRSGRGERGGRVIVQALDPAARVLRHAATARLRGLPRAASSGRREAFGYPPYGHLVRVVCSSRGARTRDRGRRRRCASGSPPPGCPCSARRALFRRRGRHRAQLVVRSPERAPGHRRGARRRGRGGRRPRARRGVVRGRRGSAVDPALELDRHGGRGRRSRRAEDERGGALRSIPSWPRAGPRRCPSSAGSAIPS